MEQDTEHLEKMRADMDAILEGIFEQVYQSVQNNGVEDLDNDIAVAYTYDDDDIGIAVISAEKIIYMERNSRNSAPQALFHIGESAVLNGKLPIAVYIVSLASKMERLDENPARSGLENVSASMSLSVVGLSFEHKYAYIIQSLSGHGRQARPVGEAQSSMFSDDECQESFCINAGENGENIAIDVGWIFAGAQNGERILRGNDENHA